jgi:hypothetical protein
MRKSIVLLYILVLSIAGYAAYLHHRLSESQEYVIRAVNNLDLVRHNESQRNIVFAVLPQTVERRLKQEKVDAQIIGLRSSAGSVGSSLATSTDDVRLEINFSKSIPESNQPSILSGIEFELKGILRIPQESKGNNKAGQNPDNRFAYSYGFAPDGKALYLNMVHHQNFLPVAPGGSMTADPTR